MEREAQVMLAGRPKASAVSFRRTKLLLLPHEPVQPYRPKSESSSG